MDSKEVTDMLKNADSMMSIYSMRKTDYMMNTDSEITKTQQYIMPKTKEIDLITEDQIDGTTGHGINIEVTEEEVAVLGDEDMSLPRES